MHHRSLLLFLTSLTVSSQAPLVAIINILTVHSLQTIVLMVISGEFMRRAIEATRGAFTHAIWSFHAEGPAASAAEV